MKLTELKEIIDSIKGNQRKKIILAQELIDSCVIKQQMEVKQNDNLKR